MMREPSRLRDDALSIWHSGLAAVQPERLIAAAWQSFPSEWLDAIRQARRIIVVGGGKAGTGMVSGLETALADDLPRVHGLINIPTGLEKPTRRIRLHPARPAASNFPTAEGVTGTCEMLQLLASAGSDDVAITLISGGGSALMPAPSDGISLAEKLHVTQLLHASGATIHEMNTVRKHLSRSKGGGFARVFAGKLLISLIISDVVGDPLDVIASGPTAIDSSTFANAHAVLNKYRLWETVAPSVRIVVQAGQAGDIPETLKSLPSHVHNRIIGSNTMALQVATESAQALGYSCLNLGSMIEGESREVAKVIAGIIRSIQLHRLPLNRPACLLLGGETTVSLGANPGLGGRNQEFTLALGTSLGQTHLPGVCILSAGTDGEDGPTDAAGAIMTHEEMSTALSLGLSPEESLQHHDSYHFHDQIGGLVRTGLTGTNVTDVRVILVT